MKKAVATTKRTMKEEEAANTNQPLLTFRSPLDPSSEYHVVWAQKSLWKRRLESMQQRYPSDRSLKCWDSCSDSSDSDQEDNATWVMDGSQSIAPMDRWGESSASSMPDMSIRYNSDSDGDDDDELSACSCPVFDRWATDASSVNGASWDDQSTRSTRSTASSDAAPSRPARRPQSPVNDDDSIQDESSTDARSPYAVRWLDDFYSTVTYIRRDGLCPAIQEMRTRRKNSAGNTAA
ncbi:expressed unknown protein [Seminavis robusta]|uniref:Uncharacterized protein n=1 Tax=Seminavis robusta TaxID=568900 RepID=A0A9N8E547_9STRA|nr:expressed unknown protein [Seminavis robusta]|eukprot:Sro680_g186310.1 n/a (236) ;mRNA; f:47789-48496